MVMELAVVGLTYITLLVTAYVVITYTQDERNAPILRKAYQNAYSILAFNFLIVIALIELPHLTLNQHITSYLLLMSKLISVLTLAGTIFLLTRYK